MFNLISANASSDAGSEIETENKTTPISARLGIETHKTNSLSSEDEPIFLKIVKKGENDKVDNCQVTANTLGTCSSKKDHLTRSGIGRQIPALKMKIEILQDDKKRYEKVLEERDKELAKYVSQVRALGRKINRQEHEMKAMRQNDKIYNELVSESNNLRRENEELKKMNQDYERNYSKLEKKYDKLKQEQEGKLHNQPNQLLSSTFASTVQTPTEEEEASLTIEEKFDRDLEAAISASLVVCKPNTEEKCDHDLKKEIDFVLELSKRDDEIRKQREHSLAFEELFRNNVQAERAVKRKLENVVSEKEKVTKRLKVVEQEKELLVDEKEKLVDELECTTLCGFCTENMKDVAFEPCGHIWACSACVKLANISNCPTCRKKIKNFRKVFIA